MNILRLPDLGASTGEAEVVVWLKAIGESITVGEPVLEVQSDKANVEVEATISGTLARVLASVGQIIKPGDALAVIVELDEPRDAAAIERPLAEIVTRLQALQQRAEAGALSTDDVQGATSTLSNYGMLRTVTWANARAHPGTGCGTRHWPSRTADGGG